jgi:hypothetical protein
VKQGDSEMRVDKTLSELWNLADDGDVGETAKMAIKAIQKLQDESRRLKQERENLYEILANVRDTLLDLVNPEGNQCGDMLACTVSNPKCLECLAKQIRKQIEVVYPFGNPQDLTSICLKCGVDLGKCICNK